MIKKRIAIFSPAAFGSKGHGYIYARNLIDHLKDEYAITLFTIKPADQSKAILFSDINLVQSNIFGEGAINKSRFLKFKIIGSVLYGFYRLFYNYRLLREFYTSLKSYNVYHLFEFEYIAAIIFFKLNKGILKNTLLGFHSSDFLWIKDRPIVINIYKTSLGIFLPFLIRHSKACTVHGEFLKNELAKNLRVENFIEKIRVIDYGCTPQRYSIEPRVARERIGIAEDFKVGLFFGVLREDKGIIELLNSFNKVNDDCRLLIAGSEGDISYSTIEFLIQNNGIADRVILLKKYLSEEEVDLCYAASDFVFITHKAYHVAFSGPLILAVEHSRPVIASDSGEIGAFVSKNLMGLLYRKDDFNDFITVLNRNINLLSDLKNTIDFKSIQEQYSWKMMAKKIALIYSE